LSMRSIRAVLILHTVHFPQPDADPISGIKLPGLSAAPQGMGLQAANAFPQVEVIQSCLRGQSSKFLCAARKPRGAFAPIYPLPVPSIIAAEGVEDGRGERPPAGVRQYPCAAVHAAVQPVTPAGSVNEKTRVWGNVLFNPRQRRQIVVIRQDGTGIDRFAVQPCAPAQQTRAHEQQRGRAQGFTRKPTSQPIRPPNKQACRQANRRQEKRQGKVVAAEWTQNQPKRQSE